MKYQIRRATVIGAGTMGAAIAAHLANAGVPVTLLDIVPRELTPEEEKKGLTLQDREVRNRIVRQGFERALQAKPAAFFTPEHAALVTLGNLEDDLEEAVKNSDWVIEAVVERLDIKRSLMERIDAIRPEHTIVSTNTSGIPIKAIAEGRSEGFRQHFLGTHFFNPPRYLHLLEIIPGPDTLPEVVEAISEFGERRLGKGIVPCKDTPNFIGNRIAFGSGAFVLDYVLEHGYTVEEVDAITGPLMGRPKTATFRLIDLVGVDVWDHVGRNLREAIPHDAMAQKYLASERVNNLIAELVKRGWLGNKTKQGFYKEVRQNGKKEYWHLNPETMEYEPPQKPRFESVGKVKDIEDLGERLKAWVKETDRAAQLVRAILYQGFAYASSVIPEIADTPKPIDDAMRWGFAHQAGPFEVWDKLGVAETVEAMKAEGFPPAPWVEEMLAAGFSTFYQYQDGRKVGVYHPGKKAYEPIQRSPNIIVLKEEKAAGKVIESNPGATLVDLGDGVVAVEFHTKANALDDDIFAMMNRALDLVEEGRYEGVVIGNDADNFSAGANLFMVVVGAQQGMWDQLEQAVKAFQDLNMRIRYFPKPVVVAPAGLALGGGCEIVMHGSRVVAAAETYIGLVEVGAGVIPAGGGTKEMVRRIVSTAMRTKNADALPFLQRAFEQIGMAKVATSAEEARQMGILGEADRVVMNRDHLLAEAKREVLHMLETGWHPPVPQKLYAAGRDALAALRVGIYMMKEGGYISEYDAHIGNKLAYVLTGGDLSAPQWVSEQYFLDLEREAFLSLCGEPKTQERMWHILQTGKPLRN